MTYPLGLPGPETESPGVSYAVLLVRSPPTGVLDVLRVLRFTGWVGPRSPAAAGAAAVGGGPDAPAVWTVAVAASIGTVASRRRGVVEVGDAVAVALGGRVLAVRVVDDRQLALVAWDEGVELGRYVSDPSHGADDDVLPDPLGTRLAVPLAAWSGRPADPLTAVLAAHLDPDSTNESERLADLLALLDLPPWLVAVDSLPRDIPTGPRAADLTRLRAGRPGLLGRLAALGTRLTRRRPPPPVIPDPPRAAPDPWFL